MPTMQLQKRASKQMLRWRRHSGVFQIVKKPQNPLLLWRIGREIQKIKLQRVRNCQNEFPLCMAPMGQTNGQRSLTVENCNISCA